MAKPVNRRRGEVSLSEARDGAVLRLTMDAIERLFALYQEDYINVVIQGVTRVNPSVIRNSLLCMLEGVPDGEREALIKDAPWDLTWNDVNVRILDAIFLSLHEKTWEQFHKDAEERADKEFEEAKGNPRKQIALLSKLSSELGPLLGSDQTKSDNTLLAKSDASPKPSETSGTSGESD